MFQAIDRAISSLNPVIVYPVTSFTTYKGLKDNNAFSSCYILKAGSTCEDLEHVFRFSLI